MRESTRLKPLAQELEDEITDERSGETNREVGDSEDVGKASGEGFSLSGRMVELAHQKV